MNTADRHLVLAVADAHACHSTGANWVARRRAESRVSLAAQAAQPIATDDLRDFIAVGVQHGEWLAEIRARSAE